MFEQAAAHAFHICLNHPFIDGNKRTALGSALVFFSLKGIELDDPKEDLYELMIKVAKGKASKREIATKFRALKSKKRDKR